MCGSRGGGAGVWSPPPEKSQNYSCVYQYRSGSHEKSQSYQARIQCWPSSAFRWRTDYGPAYPLINLKMNDKTKQKKTLSKLDPSNRIFWIRAWKSFGMNVIVLVHVHTSVQYRIHCMKRGYISFKILSEHVVLCVTCVWSQH